MVKVSDFLTSEEPAPAEKRTLIKVPEPLRTELVGKGHRYATLTFWVSKVADEQIEALPISLPPPMFTAFRAMAGLGSSEVVLREHDMVIRNGHVAFLRSTRKRPADGKYLLLGIAFDSFEQTKAASEWIRRAVNETRLSAGLGAAITCAYETTDHLDGAQSSFRTAEFTYYYYYSAEQDIDNSWHEGNSQFYLRDFDIKPEAEQLLHLSLENGNASVRFLLTWLALEAQVGGGPRIKQFFQGVTKSPFLRSHAGKLSKEIEHLASVRGELAHKGRFKSRPFDYPLLYLLLRIACLKSASQREVAALELITYLSVRTSSQS